MSDFNKELYEEKFSTLHKRLDNQDEVLNKILTQATNTNGSVKRLQLWQATGEGWIKGFGVAVACIIALVGVIYFSITNQENKTQKLIEEHISQTK